jgi:N utilization substance protein B
VSEFGASRHLARERALELLYEQSIKQRSADEIVAALPMAPEPYTVELVRAVEESREWAETLLQRHSLDWPIDRMAVIDRLIMTMALCEMRLSDAPPVAVVLDEAVEFARTFSTDSSPGFVNGVLAACVNDLE